MIIGSMARPPKPSRVVAKAIEQYKAQELSYKELIKILKQYPDHPIGDLVPDYRRQQQQDIINSGQVPKGAIIANLDRQAPNGSWSVHAYYVDKIFRCVDCGIEQTWTAKQQQWWYEVAKGRIDSDAARCRNCRKLKRKELQEQKQHMENIEQKKKSV